MAVLAAAPVVQAAIDGAAIGFGLTRDGATDASVSAFDRDASAPSLDVVEDADQAGPRALATCGAYELVAPAQPLSKPYSPSLRVENRYAVLSTSSTRTNFTSSGSSHHFHEVIFSWFDPQTARLSESVTLTQIRCARP